MTSWYDVVEGSNQIGFLVIDKLFNNKAKTNISVVNILQTIYLLQYF